MSEGEAIPETELNEGRTLHGFVVERVVPSEVLRAVIYIARHEKTGARVLHVHADDRENMMLIAFLTPPPDDTGLPHILEHSVLCGSRRFPVKDPFVELLRTSMATFLNAFTYPDRTGYPCSSAVEKDFFNLATVYFDAAFHPRIEEEHFKQEGHHFDFEEPGNPDSPLVIKGIVYNEMKGAYSDLDSLVFRHASQSICPDNAYGRDSGGDPRAIPTLEYESFREFHRTYYHPANAHFLFYGGIAPQRHLAFLEEQGLGEFDPLRVDVEIDQQPRWSAPAREEVPYPVSPNEAAEEKAAIQLTWLTQPATDIFGVLAMHLIEDVLLGNAASPLRKALIDSRLGSELTHFSGYMDEQRDTLFGVGLKGARAQNAARVEELVQTTCRDLVTSGLGSVRVERALHQLEVHTRRIGGMYPLHVLDRAFGVWPFGADPVPALEIEKELVRLRKRIEDEPGFLEGMLDRYLVSNPHYSVLTFRPDPALPRRRAEEEAQKLETIKASKSREELERIAEEARELDRMQSAPNPPEALATLPRLSPEDVPAEGPELETESVDAGGVELLETDIFTNGLNYLTLAVDISHLSGEQLLDLPLYIDAVQKMGAGDLDYVGMAEREADHTSGVRVSARTQGRVDDPGRYRPVLLFGLEAMERKTPEALEVVADRLLRPRFDDLRRLEEVVRQGYEGRMSNLIPAGHRYAASYAGRHLSANLYARELLGGLTQIRRFRDLAGRVGTDAEAVAQRLAELHAALIRKDGLVASFAGTKEGRDRVRDWLESMAGGMPSIGKAAVELNPPPVASAEAVEIASEVGYAARLAPVAPAADEAGPALHLLAVQLGFSYLWEEIRVKGGAYGGNAAYRGSDGAFTLSSYRDPSADRTVRVMDGVASFVQDRMDLSREAVEQAIIGTMKTLDRPIRAAEADSTALHWHLTGSGPDFRRGYRRRLLELDADAIRAAADRSLAPGLEEGATCVAGPAATLDRMDSEDTVSWVREEL